MSTQTLREMTMKDGSTQQPEIGPDRASIHALAYENWLARGCPEGSPEVDWLRAEQELNARTEFVSLAA
jgi:Protein of unknown function (DUF2934)